MQPQRHGQRHGASPGEDRPPRLRGHAFGAEADRPWQRAQPYGHDDRPDRVGASISRTTSIKADAGASFAKQVCHRGGESIYRGKLRSWSKPYENGNVLCPHTRYRRASTKGQIAPAGGC